ncbi:MAG: hypothetical protein ACRDPS_21030 [Nocardioides sp.]|uniref:hypothetical protein n=1 Tax=Nocardioides sp. TaxID=35761 RepID=UPI003D6AD6ED
MDEELTARGFWGPRQETPDQIADKLVAFVTGLNDVVGDDITWSAPGLRGQSLADPEVARQVISKAFADNTDAPHLGISQAYDARGKKIKMISITMGVGGYSDSPKMQNRFVLDWFGDGGSALADPILRHIVSVWDPDWADVTAMSFMEALIDVQPVGKPTPKVGYLTYLSEARAQALPGGLENHKTNLDGGGAIIGSGEGDGFLSVDKATEFAKVLRLSPAFSPTPTDRSKF